MAEQCFPISPGTYQFSAKVLLLTPSSNGSASIFFSFYSGKAYDNCSGPFLKSSDHASTGRRGEGTWDTITAGPLEAPPGTYNVAVTLLACAQRDVVVADFDDLVLQHVLPAANPPR